MPAREADRPYRVGRYEGLKTGAQTPLENHPNEFERASEVRAIFNDNVLESEVDDETMI
jgi:hypothetical protein